MKFTNSIGYLALFAGILPYACTPLAALPDRAASDASVDASPTDDVTEPDAGSLNDSGTGTEDAGPTTSDLACGDKSAWTLKTREFPECGFRRAQVAAPMSQDGFRIRHLALGRSGTGRIALAWSEETGFDVGTSVLYTTSFMPGDTAAKGTTFPEPRRYAAAEIGDLDGPGYDGIAASGGSGDNVYVAYALRNLGATNTINEAVVGSTGTLGTFAVLATGVRPPANTDGLHASTVAIAQSTKGKRAISWFEPPTAASGVDGSIHVRVKDGANYLPQIQATGNDSSDSAAPAGGAHALAFDGAEKLFAVWGTSGLSGSFAKYATRLPGAFFENSSRLLGSVAGGTHEGLLPTLLIDVQGAVVGALAFPGSGAASGPLTFPLRTFDPNNVGTLTDVSAVPPPHFGTASYSTLRARVRLQRNDRGLLSYVVGYVDAAYFSCRVEFHRQTEINGVRRWIEDTVFAGPCTADEDPPLVDYVLEPTTGRPHIAFTAKAAPTIIGQDAAAQPLVPSVHYATFYQ